MPAPSKWLILETADDVTADVLAEVEEAVEWFGDGEPMGTEALLDRLCPIYAADGRAYDVESFDNPAVRKIMRHARAVRRGQE